MNAMDAAHVIEEYRLAQEEHARALAAVADMRGKVEAARSDYKQARATEMLYERDIQRAAANMSASLEAMTLADAAPVLPRVTKFLVEYHANIGCYHCYLTVENDAYDAVDTSSLRISVEFPIVSIDSTSSPDAASDNQAEGNTTSGMPWWGVEIERNIDVSACFIEAKVDHIYVRLPINESDKDSVDGFSSFSQTARNELVVANYNRLACRACGGTLLDAPTGGLDKVLPLPSENWMEMFDFWGSGLGSFEHIPREGIFAQPRRILVGESHILVHGDDLVAGSLVDAEEHNKANHTTAPEATEMASDENKLAGLTDWEDAVCAGCHALIGDRHRDNVETVRFHKHLVSAFAAASDNQDPVNILHRYTVDNTISAQMLHVAESEGIFRFHLKASVEAKGAFPGAHIQLLSWDTRIRATSRTGFVRVLKVVYSTTQPTNAVLSANQLDLPVPLRTQEVVVLPAVGYDIIRRLEKSTALLPASQQCFNRLTVGYLYA